MAMKLINLAKIDFAGNSGSAPGPGPTPADALKFTVNADSQPGSITLTIPSGLTQEECTNIEYSLDGRTWLTFVNEGNRLTITTPTLNAGDSVYFRGQGTLISKSTSKYSLFTTSSPTFKISASGSVMSLIGNNEALTIYAFYYLFYGCTSLTTAPDLPATTLAESCYRDMFYGCSSLTTAPTLPATTLARYCYRDMFFNCTSLVNAPELPATTLADGCYYNMFLGCTSLTTAPELPATTLYAACYQQMFLSCASLVNVPELPATTLVTSCYQGMFAECTSLVNAPELPATTLTFGCYMEMFRKCTSLVNAPDLPATTLAQACYYNMFQDCANLVNAPDLPATTLATSCYMNMFGGCRSLTTAPALPAIVLSSSCYSGMFFGCTSLVNAPELPATILVDNCYKGMFYNCAHLSKITMLATSISATDCLTSWVHGVAASGTFTKDPAMTTLPTGDNGIPSGWTVVDKMPIPDAVDLGLSSGLKWSTFNLGATRPEDVGLYFSWGNTEGHAKDSGYDFSQSNYNSTPAASISTDLSPNEDAANVLLGNGWRMPALNEFTQLISQTDHEWTEINGKAGMKLMKKSDHSVFIFIPASGMYSGTTLQNVSEGLLWLPKIYTGDLYPTAYFYNINANSQYGDYWRRYCGINIRPVLPTQ